jgi:tetratricopeptide (TPR) repeat protein
MGQCSSTPSSEDVKAGGASACGVLLTATKPVPVVGEVAKVLLEVAKKYGEISGTLDEAEQVKKWAFVQARTFKDLEARTSDSSKEIDEVLRGQLEDVARSIGELLKIAEKIKRGCFLTKRIKAGVFQRKFNSAQNAVERARVELDRTLTIKIADTVHRIEETADANSDKLDANSDKLDAIMAKIAAKDADVDAKERWRGLVATIKSAPAKNQQVLVDVAEKVVDGDGAGASAALDAAPAEVRASAAALFAKGMALYQQKKSSEAIVALKNCVARDPGNNEAWYVLGCTLDLHNGKKSSEEQIEAYQQCIALDPEHAGALNNLGLLLYDVRKDYDDAEELYKRAIASTRCWGYRRSAVCNNLGNLLNSKVRKDYDGAERLYWEAIKHCPSNATAYDNLGSLLRDVRKDYDGAEKMYRRAIEINQCASAFNNLGNLLKNVHKKYKEAEELYREAIVHDPKFAIAHNNLGNLLKDVRKDYDGAERHYRKAIELDPKHAVAHNNLGNLLKNVRKDYDGAERHYRKAIELDPKLAETCWNLSNLLERKNDIPGAIKAIEEYIRRGNPNNRGKEILARLRAKL